MIFTTETCWKGRHEHKCGPGHVAPATRGLTACKAALTACIAALAVGHRMSMAGRDQRIGERISWKNSGEKYIPATAPASR